MDIVWLAGLVVTIVTAMPVLWQISRHPKGLRILFFAEMWERFSYYGMRGLLVFFMTQHFLFSDDLAQEKYGAYTSLVYLLPLVGGYLADKFLGTRKAVTFGAVLLVAGHLLMAIEGPPARQVLHYNGQDYHFKVTGRMEARDARLIVGDTGYKFAADEDGNFQIKGLPPGGPLPPTLPKGKYTLSVAYGSPAADGSQAAPANPNFYRGIFYLALALIVMGVGFLKPNISSIVGQLYPAGDPRRDPGFTLYYYGINLGAFWAAIACGWLGTHLGWWAGFGAAGIGMALGLVVFVLGKPWLEGHGEPPDPERLKQPVLGAGNLEWHIYRCGFVGVAFLWLILMWHYLVGYFLAAGSLVVLGYLLYYMAARCTSVEAQRMALALVLIGASIVFFTLFEQAGSSLNQFAERNTVLKVGSTTISAAQTQSFNAGFILLLAPVFSALWAFLGKRHLDPNPALKFGLALVQVGAGFLVLVYGARFAGADYRVPIVFLVLAYLLHTTGELWLSPVGLSQMTKLSPAAVVSTVMATWFLASSWAQFIGGLIAQLTAAETVAGQVLDPGKALQTYVGVFRMIGIVGLALGAVLIALSPWLRHLAHEEEDSQGQRLPAH